MTALKIVFKKLAKYLLLPGGWVFRALRPRRGEILILLYHRVDDGVRQELAVTAADFAWQMDYLQRRNYRVITLDRACAMMRAGVGAAPAGLDGKSVVLTFDDGYADFYERAWPVLREHGFPCLVYLVAGFIETGLVFWWDRASGASPLMNWAQLRELAAAGPLVSFGSHTLSHPDLTRLDPAGLLQELAGSRALLEERLGRPVSHFAYPRGRTTSAVERAVAEEYRSGALLLNGRRLLPGRQRAEPDRVRLQRIPVQRSDGRLLFAAKLRGWLIGEELLRKLAWSLSRRPVLGRSGPEATPQPLRVLMGITLSEMGGAQKVVAELLQALAELPAEITVVTSPGGELLNWIAALNRRAALPIRVVELPSLCREVDPGRDLTTLCRLWTLCRTGRYDVAHFHSSKMGVLGPPAAKLAGIGRIIFTVHGWGIGEAQSRLLRIGLGMLVRLTTRLCTAVACVSEATRDRGLRNRWLEPWKARVVYNGLADPPAGRGKLRRELAVGAGVPIIGTIARLVEQKEPLAAIEIARRLREQGREFRMVLIGDGPLRERCREEIRRCRLESAVVLLGSREDARELLNDFDVFILLSQWEALPLAVIEAMLAGKPVIASRVGGLPELVQHGANGYLVPQRQLDVATAYLAELLDHPEVRAGMGRLGRQRARRQFTNRRMVAEYGRLYRGE